MNLKLVLKQGMAALRAANIATYQLDARLLLQFALSKTYEELIFHDDEIISITDFNNYQQLLNRRVKHEPIAYIISKCEFYGLDFIVQPNILIPRPETETIIDTALEYQPQNILELGVGSGCIAVTLLKQLPLSQVTAIDFSADAIKIAAQNAEQHEVAKRLSLIQSDWFSNLKPWQSKKQFNLIISNPPYIDKKDRHIMAKETLQYEPDLALYADNQGLAAYEIIAENSRDYLAPNGHIILEIGINQHVAIERIFAQHNFILTRSIADLAGITRCLVFN